MVKRCVVSRRCNSSNRRHTCLARSCLSFGQLTRTSNFLPCVMGDTIKVEGWHCVLWCPDVVYEQPGKSTWIVDLHRIQLLLNLRFAGAKTDGSLAIVFFTQIKDPRFVYPDTDGKLLIRVDGTQILDKVVVSSQKIDGTTTYECEVRHKFQGDSKAMRQHMAGHDLQSSDERKLKEEQEREGGRERGTMKKNVQPDTGHKNVADSPRIGTLPSPPAAITFLSRLQFFILGNLPKFGGDSG